MPVLLPPLDVEIQVPRYEYSVDLGGTTYQITLTWRERQESWYLALADSDGDLLIGSERLTPNIPLLQAYTGRAPTGGILIALVDGADTEIDYDALGSTAYLAWYSDAEATLVSSAPDVTVS